MFFWLEFGHLMRNGGRRGEAEEEFLAEVTNNDTICLLQRPIACIGVDTAKIHVIARSEPRRARRGLDLRVLRTQGEGHRGRLEEQVGTRPSSR